MSVETHAISALSQEHLDALFADAHTAHAFTDAEVADHDIERIYDAIKWAPTSMNTQPLRITWVRSPEARNKVVEAMSDGNKAKVAAAPMTAVLSADPKWFEHFGVFAPWAIERQQFFADNPDIAQKMARDNAFIQAGYFITAVRALGLGAGPMGGFDAAHLDSAINSETGHTAVLVVNIGHPDPAGYRPRGGRLDASVATRVI